MPRHAPTRLPARTRPLRCLTVVVGLFLSLSAWADLPADTTPTATAAPVLRLADLLESARRHQPQLMAARAQTAAAAGRLDQAATAYYPQVSATLQYQRTTGNFAARPGTVVPANATVSLVPDYNAYALTISASQLVWDFGQTRERVAAAQAGTDVLQAGERVTELQVLAGVRRAYFQALAQQALIGVAEETLNNQQRHLRQVEGFVRAGTRPEIDVAQARTAWANAQVQLIQAQSGLATAKALLLQTAGMTATDTFALDDVPVPPVADEDAALPVLLRQAEAERPEIAVLQRQRTQQERIAAAIDNALWPTLAVAGNVTGVGVALDGITPNWNIGAVLNWPLFQGGIHRAQAQEAQANLAAVDAQAQNARLQIQTDVEQARLAVHAAKAVMGAAELAHASAREQLRLAEGRYAHGLGNMIELGDTQLALTNAAVQLISARFSLSLARVQLQAALGQL